jgi:exoribonuclease-2
VERGDLVGLKDAGQPKLAVVLKVDGKRVTVAIGQQARLARVPLRELQPVAAAAAFGSTPAPERIGAVPWSLNEVSLRAWVPPRRDVAAAWLLLSSTGGCTPWQQWCALVAAEPTPLQLAGWWLWLQGDQPWFTLHHGEIAARPLSQLRQRRHDRRRSELAHQRERHWHGQLRQRQVLSLDGLDSRSVEDLALLQRWAGGASEEPLPASLLQALRQADCRPEAAAIRHLLVDLGQWDPHALPSLRQSPWAHGFSDALEKQAQQLIERAPDPQAGDERRRDRTHLHCVTIDDEDTEDIDDAIGLERCADGRCRLWIHVADPGRLLLPDDPLDASARGRGASLYLARGILPMLPWPLSIGPLSLRAGRRCPAWSFWAELDEGGNLQACGFERTWVRPAYRLSYGDADDLIDLAPPEEPDLAEIHGLLLRRRRWREQRGALLLDQPEGRVRARDGELTIAITEPTSSRLMIAEAMILAGSVAATQAIEHGLALPFRSQLPAPLPAPQELAALPAGPVRHAALKACLSRGLTTTTPAPHSSLGLDAYVQVTSPIRRYGDLLAQRQLECLWAGRAPLPAGQLQDLLAACEDPLRQGNQISRDDQRHWRQVWFEAHRTDHWPAVLLRWLRESERLALIWIEALAMELPAQCPAGSAPGDALSVSVHRVDPLQDCLQLRAHR